MDMELIIYGAIGLVLLFLVINLLKWPIKILINGLVGIVLLYVTNYVGGYFDFSLAINAVTALIAGFLGIPGIIFLIVFTIFF